jgi:hypothetical protein
MTAHPTAEPTLHIVFDGPPGPESGRFVECEAPDGRSINAGEWHERGDGYWELRIAVRPTAELGDLEGLACAGTMECPYCGEDTPHPHRPEDIKGMVPGLMPRLTRLADEMSVGNRFQSRCDFYSAMLRAYGTDYSYRAEDAVVKDLRWVIRKLAGNTALLAELAALRERVEAKDVALEWIRKIAEVEFDQDDKLRSRGARVLKRIADKAATALEPPRASEEKE